MYNKITDYLYKLDSSDLFDLCEKAAKLKGGISFECKDKYGRMCFNSSFTFGIDFEVFEKKDFLTREVEHFFICTQTKNHMPHKGCTPEKAIQLLTKLTK